MLSSEPALVPWQEEEAESDAAMSLPPDVGSEAASLLVCVSAHLRSR